MPSPRKIHVVTKAYLSGWAMNGLVIPVSVEYGKQKPKSPAAVGWDLEWWGSDDAKLNRICEEACGKLESKLPDALAAVESWPLSQDDRAVIAQFLALHVLRTRAFPTWFAGVRDSSLAGLQERFRSRNEYETFKHQRLTDRERAVRLISLINKLGSVFGSMHWTLLHFDEPLLITSDQPVAPVPLLTPGVIEPFVALPGGGWLDTLEVRCPLTPHLALLATWHMGPEAEPVAATWQHAVNLNASSKAQAAKQFIQTPEREPAMPGAIFAQMEPPILLPISIQILPGYTLDAATRSLRREQTSKIVTALIEQQDHKTITLLTEETRSAA
jgi:uncharacterized protein DUF4238